MKNITLFLFFSLAAVVSRAQPKTTSYGTIRFEGSDFLHGYLSLYRDTATNPNCIWQIGKPQKTVFTSSFSPDKAIVTDTLNTYPPNDTSSFIIKMSDLNFAWYIGSFYPHSTPFIRGRYKVDSDSLSDYGSIAISMDMGSNWIDILEDTVYNFVQNSGTMPVLTGSSDGWQIFTLSFAQLADSFTISPSDTVLLKFTFVSDSTETNRDGLIFDDFVIMDWWESVDDPSKTPVDIYPNPAASQLRVRSPEEGTLFITDLFGKTQCSINIEEVGKEANLDLSALSSGFYIYTYRTRKGATSGKLTILH